MNELQILLGDERKEGPYLTACFDEQARYISLKVQALVKTALSCISSLLNNVMAL